MLIRNREFDAPWPNLTALIEARLTGMPTPLPPLSRDEDPADIFVDLSESDERWKSDLQGAVGELLARWVEEFRPEDANRVQAVGELCYLAARIGSTDALPSLQRLASNARATRLLVPGEDLRLRALRAFVGLLGLTGRPRSPGEYLRTLEEALDEPRMALTALVGLIGLWPEEAEYFRRRLPPNSDGAELLQIALELTFPGRNRRL